MCFLSFEDFLEFSHESHTTDPHTTDQPATTNPPTTFLSLPAELRNLIYMLCDDFSPTESRESLEREPDSEVRRGLILPPSGWTSIWVKRRSDIAARATGVPSASASLSSNAASLRKPVVQCENLSPRYACGEIVEEYVKQLTPQRAHQPALSRVCRQIRNETLAIFYGAHSFLFTVFDTKSGLGDTHDVETWLATIGPTNAGFLRSVKLVCRHRNNKYRHMQRQKALTMRQLGVRAEAVVTVGSTSKVKHGTCFCEDCIREAVGE